MALGLLILVDLLTLRPTLPWHEFPDSFWDRAKEPKGPQSCGPYVVLVELLVGVLCW